MGHRTTAFTILAALSALFACACSCDKIPSDNLPLDRTLIVYSAGFNSLSGYLRDDINELAGGTYIPGKGDKNALFVVNKSVKSSYKEQTSPYIIRLYTLKGAVVRDTVHTFPTGTVMADASTLQKALDFINSNYPSSSCGMVVTSHATGWLPQDYYSNSGKYDTSADPYAASPQSITQENGDGVSYEIELEDFAAAIPVKMDYILFDACLTGGVEVAYTLRDKAGRIGFSQAEVLSEGFNYSTMASHLLAGGADARAVCEDYFNQYDNLTGIERSATISLVDCSKLDGLAKVCKELFEKYRDGLASVNPESVQGYFRSGKHWFYDLEDIVAKAGATDEDLGRLGSAIEGCIIYKAATPSFMKPGNGFDINTFCGLSMYLPADGSADLDNYYRTLSWNRATGLVK